MTFSFEMIHLFMWDSFTLPLEPNKIPLNTFAWWNVCEFSGCMMNQTWGNPKKKQHGWFWFQFPSESKSNIPTNGSMIFCLMICVWDNPGNINEVGLHDLPGRHVTRVKTELNQFLKNVAIVLLCLISTTEKWNYISHTILHDYWKTRGHLDCKSTVFDCRRPAPKGPELETECTLGGCLLPCIFSKNETLVVEGVWMKKSLVILLFGINISWFFGNIENHLQNAFFGDMLVSWRVSFWGTGTHWNSTETEGHRKGQETCSWWDKSRRSWPFLFHHLCPLRGFPRHPVLDRAFVSTFSRKKGVARTHPFTRRDLFANVSSCKTCPPVASCMKAKADAKAKASQPLRRGWQMKMTRLAIAWDHHDCAHGAMALRQLSSRATHCGTQPQYFLPQEGSLGLNFWIRSHRGSLAWEKSLGLGFCKVSCGQTVTERLFAGQGFCNSLQHTEPGITSIAKGFSLVCAWFSDAVLMKNGPALQMVHGAAMISISEMYMPRDPPGNLRLATAGICSDFLGLFNSTAQLVLWRRIFRTMYIVWRITSMYKLWSLFAIWKGVPQLYT